MSYSSSSASSEHLSGLEELSSERLLFGAECYTAPPLIILSYGEQFLVGFGFSGNREYIGAFSPDQLIDFLRRPLPKPVRRAIAPEPNNLNIDLEL